VFIGAGHLVLLYVVSHQTMVRYPNEIQNNSVAYLARFALLEPKHAQHNLSEKPWTALQAVRADSH